ncbi:MAG TPA: XdhC/CoxI family protein, partial [Terriglobales bacterium]|nr:XdhC/CoxI family protein [Terriglobales bacterium]
MTDLEHILPLWSELENLEADYVLATVVAVEGSSYRRPGARMLLAQDGRRAGTVSGGCLEAEVAKRAWWLTSKGPVVERYSTLEDDGDLPYGSGCGGVVYILLERRNTASRLLHALKAAWDVRRPLAIATVLDGPHIGERAWAGRPAPEPNTAVPTELPLQELAEKAFTRRASLERRIEIDGIATRVWADYRAARPGLWIFGAGDDARPMLKVARELGWFVAIADGRSHLATPGRFPAADQVRVLKMEDLPDPERLPLLPTDAAVLMTHSFEQDSHILAALMSDAREFPYAYLGVLGPQRRTREALAEAARLRGLNAEAGDIEAWLAKLHAPTGIDLGADTSPSIALSILAEIQQALNAATGLPLRQVRATGSA